MIVHNDLELYKWLCKPEGKLFFSKEYVNSVLIDFKDLI